VSSRTDAPREAGGPVASLAANGEPERTPRGAIVDLDGEPYYRIAAVDRLPPFLINLPTDTDLWMFVSSAGGVTAGRRDPSGALFPYETVDRLHDAVHHTGPATMLRVERAGAAPFLWQPLAPADPLPSGIERSLSKSLLGHRLVFEEFHAPAGLRFSCRWAGGDETGWVRTATLSNLGRDPVTVSLVDGLRNVLPSGVPLRLQQESSCLVDAYKRVDVDEETGLGIVSLTARIHDGPDPAEELRATTVWSHGLPGGQVVLGLDALRSFQKDEPPCTERVRSGERGHYFVRARLTLPGGAQARWHVSADTRRSHVDIARLRARLRDRRELEPWIEDSLERSAERLRRIVGSADAFQTTGHAEASAHHLANVLYNCLRGGAFVDQHQVETADFDAFLSLHNRGVHERHARGLSLLPPRMAVADLDAWASRVVDPDLRRLCLEYLPLYFGRRHGDPSRPWNRFSILVRNPDGSRALRHEGNWRDVFQNWEALGASFPGFLSHMVAKFLDGSTVDGFNPYRVTHEGVDWEVRVASDPDSTIGYWGDHQVVYLVRLLESVERHEPGLLEEWLGAPIFTFADVPYRIVPYREIVARHQKTIRFDDERQARVDARVAAEGADGKLVHEADGSIRHVTLLEKLLIPALAKLSNFVPAGGIWMNTDRPEWNDANNALAGRGLSVVTLCHLRRYLAFVERLLERAGSARVSVSAGVVEWLRQVGAVFTRETSAGDGDPAARRTVMDRLGLAFEAYRTAAYRGEFGARTDLETLETLEVCRAARTCVERAIRSNRRDDGLFHSYHVLDLESRSGEADIHPLDVMLEGQVAALDSGMLAAREALALLDALFASTLYREDLGTFLLYPDRPLPAFLDRNAIPEAKAGSIPLLQELLAAGDATLVERDAGGVLRFHGDFSNARDVASALDRLSSRTPWTASVARDRAAVEGLFEEVFGHRTFTGRSSRMVAYEGLGCVYWHMVAKLLLAVQEAALSADDRGEPADITGALASFYHRIRRGLGYEHSVSTFGAFPTDPHSHTPAHGGAQQPGMTGQVKEEILARFGELGVRVRSGIVEFAPTLLRASEFLAAPATFRCPDANGITRPIDLAPGELAFSFAQVPVVYVREEKRPWIRVTRAGGEASERDGGRLDPAESAALLSRDGTVTRIDVGVPLDRLRGSFP
jgi:hypothetical protein